MPEDLSGRGPRDKHFVAGQRPLRPGHPDPGPLRDRLERFIADNRAQWAAVAKAEQAAFFQKELAQAGFDDAALADAGLDAVALFQQGLAK